jgi:hypothetical protein
MLRSQQYDKLPSLARSVFTHGSERDRDQYQQEFASRVVNEASDLVGEEGRDDPGTKQKDWANAAALIRTVSDMDPPLPAQYIEDLRRISARLADRQRRAGVSPATQPGAQ